MANRIPLIVDTLNDNKIKELPIGDNLDLGGAGITNAGTINATDVRINNVSFNNPLSGDYNDLTNKPVIPTVPTVLSAFTNDLGYLASGTTTDQINEGTTNLYFTNARARLSLSASGGLLTYNNTIGYLQRMVKFYTMITQHRDLNLLRLLQNLILLIQY